jgi:hypothetical protein
VKALIIIVSYIAAISIFHGMFWFISSFIVYDFSYFNFQEWGGLIRGVYLFIMMMLGVYGPIMADFWIDKRGNEK